MNEKTISNYAFNPVSTAFLVSVQIMALGAFFPVNFSWSAIVVFLLFYWLTASVGICFGLHRLLSHRGFKIPLFLEWFVVFCAVLACEGTPKKWIAHHRLHHKASDTNGDPHNASQGFFWAHFGWMCYKHSSFDDPKTIEKLASDICNEPFFRPFNNFAVIIGIQVVLGLTFFYIGGLSWVFWGIFLRLTIVWHSTWLVNSAAHYFGYKNFKLPDPDRSTNCWWVGLLAWGEGWHNNHHALPRSARHGIRWYEIDTTWMLISLLEKCGIAKEVTTVEVEYLNEKPFSASIGNKPINFI